mgnify:CR=1 FL=1
MAEMKLTFVGNNRPTRLVEAANKWFQGRALYKTWDQGFQDPHLYKERYNQFDLHLAYNPDAGPVMDIIPITAHYSNEERENKCLIVLNPIMEKPEDLLSQLDKILGSDFISAPYRGYRAAGSDNIPWSNIRNDLANLLDKTIFAEPEITPEYFSSIRREILRRTALAEKANKWFENAELNPRPGKDPMYGFSITIYSTFNVEAENIRPYYVSCIERSDWISGILKINLSDIEDPDTFAETITKIFLSENARAILCSVDYIQKIWNDSTAQKFIEALRNDE